MKLTTTDFKCAAFVAFLMFAFWLSSKGQCDEATQITSLPFYDTWCVEQSDQVEYCNPCYFLDPSCGCWDALQNPRFFEFETGAGGLVTFHVSGDLCNTAGFCGGNTYYTLFDACPFEGGTVVSSPTSASGTQLFNCWNYSGNVVTYYNYKELVTGNWLTTSDPSGLIQPGVEYYIQMILSPNTSYFLSIQMPGSCFNNAWTWGCVEFEMLGLGILELVPQEPAHPSEYVSPVVKVTNLLNQEVTPVKGQLLLYHHRNGEVEKVVIR